MSAQPQNVWIDRFTNHPVHAGLTAVENALSAAEAKANDDYDAATSVARAQAVVIKVRAMLEDSDPSLVSTAVLDSINATAVNITSSATAYAADGNPTHLANANVHADSTLTCAVLLPLNRHSSSVKALGDAATVLRRALDKHVASVRAEADGAVAAVQVLRTELTALQAIIEVQKTRLESSIVQAQTSATTAETERTVAFAASEVSRQTQAATTEDARRTLSATNEDARKAVFETLIDGVKTDFAETEQSITKAAADRAVTFDASAASQAKAAEALGKQLALDAAVVVTKIEEEKAKAEKIVHVVGNTGMVGGYQQTANAERASSQNWSNVTVVAMFALIGVAIWTLTTAPREFTWPYLASRVFVASAVAILATYAGNRASGHRIEERHLRRTELEMASIDPYLALMPEDDRNAVKMKVADRLFAQSEAREADKAGPSGSIVDLAKTMSETAKSAFEAAKSIGEKK